MAKTVFTFRRDSPYDDLPEKWYHFPNSYLNAAKNAIGDWIIYYEPGRAKGRKAYFATARVTYIEQDKSNEDRHYAHVSNFLAFNTVVPFRNGDFYYESRIRRVDGLPNLGVLQRSVREIPDHEFELILSAGFGEVDTSGLELGNRRFVPQDVPETYNRSIVQRVENRYFRDAAFAKQVKDAYNHTCSITGLRFVNGGGRSEVQAAHIRPVHDQGPDTVKNGLALSGTVHWMFDRGLISISNKFNVLERKTSITAPLLDKFNPDRKLILPRISECAPHKEYLEYHRDVIFKG